jgi:hypothetical protein
LPVLLLEKLLVLPEMALLCARLTPLCSAHHGYGLY